MSERVKIVLKNSEAIDTRIAHALSLLAKRPFASKLAWKIADIETIIEEQTKKYQKALLQLFKSHGAKHNGSNGYVFDKPTGDPEKDKNLVLMTEACSNELIELNELEIEHEIELMELPEKVNDKEIEYEPIIFIALRKFLKR